MKKPYQKTMYACFIGYIVQAIVNNFVPLLFVTFQTDYRVPLQKITLLITVNFLIQLCVDLLSAGFIATGFVLLTDDGAFAHDILSPKKHIPKTYHALVDGPITEQMERDFAQGIRIGPDQTLPASLKKLSSCERGDWGEVILREGLYHQIKRMFGVYGLKVLELKRVKMGRLPLDSDLKEGECRELTPEELRLVASREEE